MAFRYPDYFLVQFLLYKVFNQCRINYWPERKIWSEEVIPISLNCLHPLCTKSCTDKVRLVNDLPNNGNYEITGEKKVAFQLRWAFSELTISISLKNFSPWATTVCSIAPTGTPWPSFIDGLNEKTATCLSNRVIKHSGCPHFSYILSDQREIGDSLHLSKNITNLTVLV